MTYLFIMSIKFDDIIKKDKLLQIIDRFEGDGFELIKTYDPIKGSPKNNKDDIINELIERSDSRIALRLKITNYIFDFDFLLIGEYLHVYRLGARDGRLVGNAPLETEFYTRLIKVIIDLDSLLRVDRAAIYLHIQPLSLDFENMTLSTLNIFEYIYVKKDVIDKILVDEPTLRTNDKIDLADKCLLIINGMPISLIHLDLMGFGH